MPAAGAPPQLQRHVRRRAERPRRARRGAQEETPPPDSERAGLKVWVIGFEIFGGFGAETLAVRRMHPENEDSILDFRMF
jgi:hypothetical protein